MTEIANEIVNLQSYFITGIYLLMFAAGFIAGQQR